MLSLLGKCFSSLKRILSLVYCFHQVDVTFFNNSWHRVLETCTSKWTYMEANSVSNHLHEANPGLICVTWSLKISVWTFFTGKVESLSLSRDFPPHVSELLTYLCPSLPVEHRPSTTPRHRTLFWAALVIPDQLVPCCFSSASVSRLQLLRGRPLFLLAVFRCWGATWLKSVPVDGTGEFVLVLSGSIG